MGQELDCRMHYRRRTLAGKAYLESDRILFRGEERLKLALRLKIAIKDLQSVTAQAGMLHLDFPGGPATLELGAAAEKWAHKILHPPSRTDKLGIKPGLTVRLAGEFEAAFLDELRDVTTVAGKAKADLIFFSAPDRQALAQIPKFVAILKPAGALWVVYAKGVQLIREIEVIEAGRAAGLKDTKVVSFSPTHTALRFAIPVAARY
jgi:hypothetical protein